VLSYQTEHFQILFSDLKCIVVISFIIPTDLLVEWYYTFHMFRHVLAFLLCTPAIISDLLDECVVLFACLVVSGIVFVHSIFIFWVYLTWGQNDTWCPWWLLLILCIVNPKVYNCDNNPHLCGSQCCGFVVADGWSTLPRNTNEVLSWSVTCGTFSCWTLERWKVSVLCKDSVRTTLLTHST
jgi:hypothetical protein